MNQPRRLIVAMLATATALTACTSSHQGTNTGPTLPGPSKGYLSISNTEVVFIQLGRQAASVSGTEHWARVEGAPPQEQVLVGVAGVNGGVSQTGIELGFDGSARQFGSLRSSTMEIEVPQADGTLADIVFNVASVADYNLALSHLRSNVTADNTNVSTTGPPGTVTVTMTTRVPPTSPTIPVVGCPTTYGAAPPPARAAPAPQPIDLPTATAAQLGYYTTDTYGVPPVLAPRGWSCTALLAGDGSVNISVYPRAATPPLDAAAANRPWSPDRTQPAKAASGGPSAASSQPPAPSSATPTSPAPARPRAKPPTGSRAPQTTTPRSLTLSPFRTPPPRIRQTESSSTTTTDRRDQHPKTTAPCPLPNASSAPPS